MVFESHCSYYASVIRPVFPGDIRGAAVAFKRKLDHQDFDLVPKAMAYSDAIASVRQVLWDIKNFSISCFEGDMVKIPRQQLQLLQQVLAWAS